MPSPNPAPSSLGSPNHTLYLVDISSFIFRAFYAIRSLSNRRGEPTNAIYGVATMLARVIHEAPARYLAAVYDSKEPGFRSEVYPEYKANRSEPPEDLVPQFSRIEELVRLMGIPAFRMPGAEADDLIATLTVDWKRQSPEHQVVIVSSDKDLMALVDERTRIWDTLSGKVYGPNEVKEKFGVKPTQIRDLLGLMGDSSDNIPGVPGVGPKTASDLLNEYGDLPRILRAAEEGKISGKKGETLKTHAEDARLSARLATLDVALAVHAEREKLDYQFKISEECVRFLKDMDFNSLVVKWRPESASAPIAVAVKEEEEPSQLSLLDGAPRSHGGVPPTQEVRISAAPVRGEFKTVTTEKELASVLREVEASKEFGFDLETTSLNPRQAELVGVALCPKLEQAYYIPVGHRGTDSPQLSPSQVLSTLKPYLEDPRYKKIGQNLKYDWSVLHELGLNPDGIGADTMVAAYVLEPEGRHGLDTLAANHLDYTVLTYEQVCGKGKDQIGFDQVPIDLATRYSAEDAWIALALWNALRPKLERDGVMDVFARVDLPLVGVLSRMEGEGVCIDVKWLAQLSREFQQELVSIEQEIQAHVKRPINLNSPKQLAVLLFEELKLPSGAKTKTGYSTDAKVLEALATLHEVPRLILEFREISKLLGTYVDPLPAMRDAKTGRIHATFSQTVAATGRLSSSDPNLQNIPIRSERGRKIRRAFIPSPGNCLVSADYSQIELRLLAHMSGDSELVRSFQKEEDVHRRTASEIFAISPDSVDDRQRGIAKAINFGLMYGKTPFGLAQELKIPQKEAKDIISRYFERYSGVKRFLDNQVLETRERGWSATMLGRKRHLPDIRSANPAVRAVAERMAMNTPIQGTAADMIKEAMITLDDELTTRKMRSKLIIQVHDELVLDCPKDEVEKAQKLVCDVMEGAMKLSVPLRVNSSSGENWADL